MSKLIITRGLPAAGKTTCATQWVAEDRRCRVRVNRDDLRAMIDGGAYVEGITERRIICAEGVLIGKFLSGGFDVICDDTNLPERTVDAMRDLAKTIGAGFEIIDMRLVPLETCIERNAARRERQVPEKVIRDMHFKYIEGRLPGD